MATIEDFEKIDIRIGVIEEVRDAETRRPAYRVVVDFGEEVGRKVSAIQATNYSEEELLGLAVVGVVNFPARQMGPVRSEILILGVPGADGKLSILTPTRPAELGGRVY